MVLKKLYSYNIFFFGNGFHVRTGVIHSFVSVLDNIRVSEEKIHSFFCILFFLFFFYLIET